MTETCCVTQVEKGSLKTSPFFSGKVRGLKCNASINITARTNSIKLIRCYSAIYAILLQFFFLVVFLHMWRSFDMMGS